MGTLKLKKVSSRKTVIRYYEMRIYCNNTQKIFDHRAMMNSLSISGKWTEDLDKLNIQ